MSYTSRPAAISRRRSSVRGATSPAAEPGPPALSVRSHVDTRRAAELIGMSGRTLEKWRSEGTGPPFLKLGRRVLYSLADLETWVRSRRRLSTSEG